MNSAEVDPRIAAAAGAVKNKPTDADLQVELGMAFFDAERWDEAMAAFQQALTLNPNSVGAYNGIGRVHYHIGPPAEAIAAYEKAMSLDPHDIYPAFGLGILYTAKLGDYERALETFRRGLAHNPDDPLLSAFLGSTYARMGRFDEALERLQQVVALQPDNAHAYEWLAILHLHFKRFDEAMVACWRQIEMEDAHSPRRLLGYIHDALGRHAEAITHLERSIELEPSDYEARAALVKVYRAVGRRQDADAHYAIAQEMALKDDEYGQACFEAVLGNTERALALLEVGLAKGQVQPGWIRIDPEFAFIHDDPRFKRLLGA
jgi:tetratricopeptide (TPR) repeat protein